MIFIILLIKSIIIYFLFLFINNISIFFIFLNIIIIEFLCFIKLNIFTIIFLEFYYIIIFIFFKRNYLQFLFKLLLFISFQFLSISLLYLS